MRHIDAAAYGQTGHNQTENEQNDFADLESKICKIIKAGNAIVNAQTPVERVIAIHDWKEVIK